MLTTVLLAPFIYFGRVFSGLGDYSNWPALCMGAIALTVVGGALTGVRYKLVAINQSPAEARKVLAVPASVLSLILLMFTIVYTAAFSMEYVLYIVLPAYALYSFAGFAGGYAIIWNINKQPQKATEHKPKKKWD